MKGHMTQINPFTGAVAQSPQVQRLQAAEKDQHLRRTQEAAKVTGLSTDQFEHQVESADALGSIHDKDARQSGGQEKEQQSAPEDETETEADADPPPPRLDVTG